MISYKPFWNTMDKKGVTTYHLIRNGISSGTLYRMKRSMALTTTTIDNLCRLLECEVEDIMKYEPDNN